MRRFAMVALSLGLATLGWGYPKPAAAPTRWELDFRPVSIKRITVRLAGEGVKTYWYMVYTVTNNSDREIVFHPEFALVTEKLEVVRAGVGVPPEVYKAVKAEYANTYPWLEHPRELVGKILRGEDNARDSVAVWPDFDPRASNFSVFVGGLSGEAVEVPNPLYQSGKSNPKKVPATFVLRKTLQIKYRLPTDAAKRGQVHASLGDRPAMVWVMR